VVADGLAARVRRMRGAAQPIAAARGGGAEAASPR
jgi:hypothetical protein